MRVLITGSNGFIGRNIISELDRKNIEYVCTGRKKIYDFDGTFIEADLLNKDEHTEIIERAEATHLIHLAWYAEHGKYWDSIQNLHWVDSTIHLVDAFCRSGGKYVSISGTSAEYDWSKGYLFEDDYEIEPNTLYGVSKDATRRIIASVCDSYSVPWIWGRVFIPYGPGEDSRRLIPSLHRVFQRKQNPFGVNATSYRDFIHVEDVANAFIHLITNQVHGIFNISTGEPILISDIVKNIAGIYNEDPNLILSLSTERPTEPKAIIGNNDKLKSLGWRPKYPLLHSQLYED